MRASTIAKHNASTPMLSLFAEKDNAAATMEPKQEPRDYVKAPRNLQMDSFGPSSEPDVFYFDLC